MTTAKVFVTGVGAVASTGMNSAEIWQALLDGKQGLGDLKLWDIGTWSHRKVGELQTYQPAQMLPDKKLLKVISRQDVLGIHAGMEAVKNSQLLAYRDQLSESEQKKFSEETAVFVGSPGNKYFQQYDFLPLVAQSKGDMQAFAKELFAQVHPTWLLKILPNNVLAYLGITYGFKGVNHNITNHAVSGMQALLEAFEAVKSGQAKRALVVSYDVGPEPQALFYYEKLGLLSTQDLKPFAADHDGTILAEGASALMIESEEAVMQRSAHCFAEIIGGGTGTENKGLFSIDQEGQPLYQLLTRTLERYNVPVQSVGMVVAHGNGSYLSDVTEAKALSTLFGEVAVPTTAFKWSMGHTLAASGLLDTVLSMYALQEQIIPGIANLKNVSSECSSLNLSAQARSLHSDQKHHLVVNRGFGGMNACMVFHACK